MSDDILVVPAKVTTRSIKDVSDTIKAMFATHPAITIDASAVVDTDLSFVQLVEAARRDAGDRALPLTLAAPANASITALLDRAGFLTAPSPADIDFWFHGALPQ